MDMVIDTVHNKYRTAIFLGYRDNCCVKLCTIEIA